MKVTIERLGHLGDGIAEGPVFVPMALPGEVVEGDVEGGKMAAPRILEPSSDRVKPPCSHYKSCGGCSLMHASDAFVANWKQDVVRRALETHGLTAEFRPIQTSPPQSRRRAGLAGKRTKNGAMIGFHTRASGIIIEIPNCKLLEPAVKESIPALEALTIAGTSRKAEISFTVTQTLGGVDVLAQGGKPLDGPLRIELAGIANQFGLARLTWEDELVCEIYAPVQEFAGHRVTPPAGTFLQATKDGENALVSAVLETVSGAEKVLDLFSGCGTFSLPIAEQAEVRAVEGEASMLTALDQAWRFGKGLKHLTTEARDLFRRPLLPDEIKGFDAIVIDPPRAGAEAQIAEIAASNARLVSMVSCNPVTFARDAQTLVGAGFEIGFVQVVDQFRWSPHVEIAASFLRR
ncbi:class I SAM-dependent RNA methyltransferase [Halocynthiibacter sp. C4]|uniref:class I SAM-dependent RNA methyltransferase n=1 Tax=Halocynthiibacter sp. C4 TaxID=2992758 RepID=UPI00237A8154|nr:class I SAM-dependent RNA methyltransferase [Halocynthiibacter sp. C4]MDE0590974.1 class I SAM-dependent RNA methyltransferase [Halocynthiibacter sp. C4]